MADVNNNQSSHLDVTHPGFAARVSWKSVFAGMVAALGIQLILTLVGAGVGAAMTNPYTDPSATPTKVGMGAIVWLILSGVISFGIGGYVSGLTSGFLRTRDGATHGTGALHGMLAWASAAVLGVVVAAIAGSATLGGVTAGAGAASNHVSLRAAPASTDTSRTTSAPQMTESEARAAAEQAAEVAARISLWTAVAFGLSLGAAALGGSIGCRSHAVLSTDVTDRVRSRPAVA